MRVSTIWGGNRDSENINGLMDPSTKVIGSIIESVVKVFIRGKMVVNSMDSGKIITWKALGSTSGVIIADMKDNIREIREMDLGYITGLMVENMKGGGIRGNKMD